MTTEEKIKRYEELHPEGKAFPTNKKPDEREEDMQWLDEKLLEFAKIKSEPDQTQTKQEENQTLEAVSAPVVVKKEIPVYTVNQIKCLPLEDFKKIQQAVEKGEAKVIN